MVGVAADSDEVQLESFTELGEHNPNDNYQETELNLHEINQNETKSEFGQVIENLKITLFRALKVLNLQEQLATVWCAGHENNETRMDQIRATVDHSITSGFGRCQKAFVLGWTTAAMTADGLNEEHREKLKHELRLCIKLAKTTALNTLDRLKMECFFHRD